MKKKNKEVSADKKKRKSKKEKYEVKHGLLGNANDYNVYKMSVIETITGYLIGLVGAAVGLYIFFGSYVFSIISGALAGFASVRIYNKYLLAKRKKKLLLQFKDLLESISNSLAAGRNTADSFLSASDDLKMQYGDDVDIVKEAAIINSGISNGYNVEDMLLDLGNRSGLEDITNFADVFSICNRLGGNTKKVVAESYEMIRDKIDIEVEINTLISQGKNELNVMALMPFLVVSMLNSTQESSDSAMGYAAKIFAVIMFVLAYAIGLKMTKIKI